MTLVVYKRFDSKKALEKYGSPYVWKVVGNYKRKPRNFDSLVAKLHKKCGTGLYRTVNFRSRDDTEVIVFSINEHGLYAIESWPHHHHIHSLSMGLELVMLDKKDVPETFLCDQCKFDFTPTIQHKLTQLAPTIDPLLDQIREQGISVCGNLTIQQPCPECGMTNYFSIPVIERSKRN